MSFPTGQALMITGTHSGCGKTTVTLGLLAALKRRGCAVAPFKCGPDFIDPTLHRLVTGRESRNLDPWMTGPEWTRRTLAQHCRPGEVAVIEGAMGMFDGGESSAAALARLLAVPVVLVLDVKAAAESMAAVLKGFETMDPAAAPAAVILNRVGSARHLELLRRAIEQHCRAEIIGHLPRELDFTIPHRHLGLHMGEEEPLAPKALDKLAAAVEQHLDLDRLLALAGEPTRPVTGCPAPGFRSFSADILSASEAAAASRTSMSSRQQPNPRKPGAGQPENCKQNFPPPFSPVRLGVARDAAFCFYYQDNLELLQAAGAELLFFSPLADHKLPPDLDGLYLGGGYPELYADRLAANRPLLTAIGEWADRGGVIYAECGGFIYLCQGIEDQAGVFHPLAGVFPAKAKMEHRLAALGYREVLLRRDGLFGPAGTRLRGHEFHYSRIEPMPEAVERLFAAANGAGTGYRQRGVVAGYPHLHFGSHPEAARALVAACRQARQTMATPQEEPQA
ncbi:cobyrinate a,c-diamide synthase [Desulfurivibrio sp. D14AmB]|uniref:cobyrinate a,c-diamide synthase n=1 Tax=Desulfurivibrio sp. D14AmB TaxID=3374370 RepID=UPI00376EF5F9